MLWRICVVVDALRVFENRGTMLDIPDDAVILYAGIALQPAIAGS